MDMMVLTTCAMLALFFNFVLNEILITDHCSLVYALYYVDNQSLIIFSCCTKHASRILPKAAEYYRKLLGFKNNTCSHKNCFFVISLLQGQMPNRCTQNGMHAILNTADCSVLAQKKGLTCRILPTLHPTSIAYKNKHTRPKIFVSLLGRFICTVGSMQ
jgi:hypothetical protein